MLAAIFRSVLFKSNAMRGWMPWEATRENKQKSLSNIQMCMSKCRLVLDCFQLLEHFSHLIFCLFPFFYCLIYSLASHKTKRIALVCLVFQCMSVIFLLLYFTNSFRISKPFTLHSAAIHLDGMFEFAIVVLLLLMYTFSRSLIRS